MQTCFSRDSSYFLSSPVYVSAYGYDVLISCCFIFFQWPALEYKFLFPWGCIVGCVLNFRCFWLFSYLMRRVCRLHEWLWGTCTFGVMPACILCGNTENIMETIQMTPKGRHMNRLEKVHIYCAHKQNKKWTNYCLICKILYSTSYIITTENINTHNSTPR